MTNALAGLAERKEFLERCTRCSQCKFVPAPASLQHASICPSIDYGEFHAHSGGGQLIMGAGLLSGDLAYSPGLIDAISSCTMCGGCDISCKVTFGETVEPLDSLYALRAKIVDDGQSPPKHKQLIANIRAEGNPGGHPRSRRGRWSEPLRDVLRPADDCELLIHIGSTLSYDGTKHAALQTVVRILEESGIVVGSFGENEDSCGATAFDLGYRDDAKRFAEKFVGQIKASNAHTVVTFSATAIAAFRGIYPRFGLDFGDLRVLHISEYVLELADSGIISLDRHHRLSGQKAAYHDACKLGRLSEAWQPRDLALDHVMGGFYTSRAPQGLRFGNNGCYDAPRELLRRMGLDVVELERNRAGSYCCGASGGVRETAPEAAALAASNRLAEIEDAACTTLVSGCSNCSSHLGEHARGKVAVEDLLDLLALSLQSGTAKSRGGV